MALMSPFDVEKCLLVDFCRVIISQQSSLCRRVNIGPIHHSVACSTLPAVTSYDLITLAAQTGQFPAFVLLSLLLDDRFSFRFSGRKESKPSMQPMALLSRLFSVSFSFFFFVNIQLAFWSCCLLLYLRSFLCFWCGLWVLECYFVHDILMRYFNTQMYICVLCLYLPFLLHFCLSAAEHLGNL